MLRGVSWQNEALMSGSDARIARIRFRTDNSGVKTKKHDQSQQIELKYCFLVDFSIVLLYEETPIPKKLRNSRGLYGFRKKTYPLLRIHSIEFYGPHLLRRRWRDIS
jgi:hypothetical protein